MSTGGQTFPRLRKASLMYSDEIWVSCRQPLLPWVVAFLVCSSALAVGLFLII